MLFGGLVLVALLAGIGSLVTRWVVLPIREAAGAAQRLSDGQLDERMPVRGTDDLAALATSFNDMGASLQEKLHELQELSKVQRQFVSDVSHELRTPLTTIRIAADVLFAAREQLMPASARSAELLEGQLERFESLLADLLEISRYDANAATLDAESADVCDLVRGPPADAEQLADRRGAGSSSGCPPSRASPRWTGAGSSASCANLLVNAVEHGEGRDVVVTVAARPGRGSGGGPRPRRGLRARARSSWSSTDSGGPTPRGRGPPAGPGSAWPSRWRTPSCTAAGCRRGASGAGLGLPADGAPGGGAALAGSPLPLGPDEAEPGPELRPFASAAPGEPGTAGRGQ